MYVALLTQVIAEHIDQMRALHRLKAHNVDAISQIISKNRRLSSRTMQLFLSPQAKKLALYDCSSVTSEAFQTIPDLAPNLEEVLLQYCGQLDNDALLALGRLKQLHALDLYGPYLVRKEVWYTFLEEHGARLRTLKLRETPRFDAACIQALVHYAPQLTHLGLAQIGCLNDASAEVLCGLKNLVYLDLSQPGVSAPGVEPASLHDTSILPLLAAHGPRLAHLHLDRNAALTDAVAGALTTCTELRTLSMDSASTISSEAWTQCFAGRTTLLEEVCLRSCQLDDAALHALIQAAPKLRVLNVSAADGLTAAGWTRVASSLASLEVLDVSFVRSVDDTVMEVLTQQAPRLKTVYLFGCNRITPSFQPGRLTVLGRERGQR